MNNFLLADLIVRIKVALKARLLSIKVLKNKLTINFLFLLYKIGLIRSFHILVKENNILVYLKYKNNKSIIHSIDIISKPSRRVYWSLNVLSHNYRKYSFSSFYVISTSQGLITSNDAILRKNISGEILCKIKI
jgi:ribosomal protein S8